MSNRFTSQIFVGAAVACALSWTLPAAAETSTLDSIRAIGGRLLSAEELSNVRGAYTYVSIRYNGTLYTASNSSDPSTSTLTIPLGTNTYSRVYASTSGTGGTATSTVTISGVTLKTSP